MDRPQTAIKKWKRIAIVLEDTEGQLYLVAILPGSKSTQHLGADIRPELGQHVSDRSAHETGADPRFHYTGRPAVMRIIEIGSRDTKSHAEYSGEVEHLFAGILPGENHLADRISGPVEDVLSGAFAIVPEILAQNRGQGSAIQILGSEIGNGSAEALGVRLAAIPILRVVVFPLRKGGPYQGAGPGKRVVRLLGEQLPFFFDREANKRNVWIGYGLEIGNDSQYPLISRLRNGRDASDARVVRAGVCEQDGIRRHRHPSQED